ncbi:hypothetical protein RZS08_55340, partial [Arthrospira platensis SPKY1]|nr:hypothetical protein [Arthrospira platensis SPKY1]
LDFPWLKLKENPLRLSEKKTLLKMRTYIGYSADKNLEKLEYIDNEFWINDILELKPKDFKKVKGSDKFYTTNEKFDLTKTAITVGGVLLLLLLLLI